MNREELKQTILSRRSFLCVGLDTDIRRIPPHLLGMERPCLEFNKAIIRATARWCVAYKPNTAFYEARGAEGWRDLADTISFIRKEYPGHLVIADAKRGDIGNTSAMYARAFFEDMDADAITVAPYMGEDSVTPFLGHKGKWVILLALTSNRGSADFQNILSETKTPLFESVLAKSKEWAGPDELMYVVGATRADMLDNIRAIVPDSFLLVPGVGAQGGSLEEVCRHGMNKDCGLIVNSSRGIIYASSSHDFAERAAEEASKLASQMDAELSRAGL